MKSLNYILAFTLVSSTFISCKKDDDDETPVTTVSIQQIMDQFAAEVAFASYNDLANATADMHTHIQAFRTNPTASGLTQCKEDWKTVRQTWEQTESYLFGPAATENIDPRIDTWPVNFNDLETIINSSDVLDATYINNLDDALKGFHPAEYLLYGLTGNKTHVDFSARELEFLEALSLNLKSLTQELANGWNPGAGSSFYHEFVTAGSGSSTFPSEVSAFEEMVNAMAGICDEVANGKISEPFLAQDPTLEESPYSKNSLIDFTNNIKGVQNVYLCKYDSDGKGLEDLVRAHNFSLDGDIKLKISNAITSLNNISVPFGEAIITQPTQVQNAIDAINELKTILEEELLPFVQLHVD